MRCQVRTIALSAVSLLTVLLCLLILLSGPTGAADAAGHSERVGAAPALPHGAHALGRLSPATPLSVDLALAPRNPAALSAFVRAVSTPGSASYHRYLTVAQFRRRFAPSSADVARLRSGLRAAGLTPGGVSANGLLIKLTARAGQLARAFHTSLERVRLTGGRLAYANTRAPQFSGALAGLVQGVVGLSNLSAPHALGLEWDTQRAGRRSALLRAETSAEVTGTAPTPCAAASSAAGAYGANTAAQIAAAYGFSSLYAGGDEGAGQTVALLEFEPYLSSDITTYNACYGINGGSSSDVSEINADGGVGSGYSHGPDGQGEAILDIEQILGLAPAAKVDVYEAPNSAQGELAAFTAMVQNPSVKVISTSWGECERLNGSTQAQAENTIFEEAAAQGQSVYAAAGDSGSTDCDGASTQYASSLGVDDPGSQPYVTSVGGTTLLSASNPAAQTAWNDSTRQLGAGGGGVSLQWTMPSYQSGASSALGLVNGNSSSSTCAAHNTGPSGAKCREVPDVSADADPETGYVVYFSGDNEGWAAVGGTSAAAPLWAALTALANASTYCGSASIGFANPVLYDVADNASAYSADFTDVSSGETDYTPSGYSGGLFPATTGYDMATGLGTPKAATLVPAMCMTAGGPGTAPAPLSSGSPVATSASSGSSTSTSTGPPASTGTPGEPTSSAGGVSTGSPTTSGSGSSSGTGTSSPTPTTPAACRLTALRSGPVSLSLSRRRPRMRLSIALDLPSGCDSYVLGLQRHVTTTEPHGARALDTLKLQLLSSSGRPLVTLATLSNANAARGYQTLALNLARYSGRGLTLVLLATRTGARTTNFTLRSVVLKLS